MFAGIGRPLPEGWCDRILVSPDSYVSSKLRSGTVDHIVLLRDMTMVLVPDWAHPSVGAHKSPSRQFGIVDRISHYDSVPDLDYEYAAPFPGSPTSNNRAREATDTEVEFIHRSEKYVQPS